MKNDDMKKHTHALVGRVNSTLIDYAKNVIKLSTMCQGQSETLSLSYGEEGPYCAEIPDAEFTDISIICDLSNEGVFFFDLVKVGNLEEALDAFALACSGLVKEIGRDEAAEDKEEDNEEDNDHIGDD